MSQFFFYYQDDSDLARWMDFRNTREDNLENITHWIEWICILINVNTHLTFFLFYKQVAWLIVFLVIIV